MSEQTTQSKKITVGLILSWIFGTLFALTGIVSIFSEPISGFVMLAMAAVLLPPVIKLIDQKWKFHLSGGIKIAVVVIGLIIFGATVDTSNTSTTQQSKIPKKEQISNNETTTKNEKADEQVNEEQSQTETNKQANNEKKTETIPTSDNEKVEDPKETKPAVASFGNGTHIVKTDIQAGTYRSQGTRTCYWARLSGFGGQLDDIIANGNNSPEIITISVSDAAFETSGCGQWVEIGSTYPATPASTFSDGTYEVGKHIEPGTYRADGSPDDLCYWARLSSFSHSGISGVITNGNSPTVIQISGSDKGFTAFGCGNWTKM